MHQTQISHYCHNCGYHSVLIDGVFCQFCLDFWYKHHRFPTRGDK